MLWIIQSMSHQSFSCGVSATVLSSVSSCRLAELATRQLGSNLCDYGGQPSVSATSSLMRSIVVSGVTAKVSVLPPIRRM